MIGEKEVLFTFCGENSVSSDSNGLLKQDTAGGLADSVDTEANRSSGIF